MVPGEGRSVGEELCEGLHTSQTVNVALIYVLFY